MNSLLTRILKQWFPLAIGISGMCFIIYAVIQQDIRIGANDPQIQMAEDTAASLNDGATPTITGNIDVAKSLAPFTIIYDSQGNVKNSNAFLNGKTPALPDGALHATKGTEVPGENRITWQPQEGVRLASVIVHYSKGYVLVGRNMREIERREDQQRNNVLMGWIITLAATLSFVAVMQSLFNKRK